jgi:hypothetical protein
MTDRDALDHPCDTGVWQRRVPHATFTWLREHEPVSWWDDLDGRAGYWVVARACRRGGRHARSGHVHLDARRTMIGRTSRVQRLAPSTRLPSNQLTGLSRLEAALG